VDVAANGLFQQSEHRPLGMLGRHRRYGIGNIFCKFKNHRSFHGDAFKSDDVKMIGNAVEPDVESGGDQVVIEAADERFVVIAGV